MRTGKPWYRSVKDTWYVWHRGQKIPQARGKRSKRDAEGDGLMTAKESSSDLSLIGQWQQGEQDAATELHRRYVEKLLALVQRNMANRFSPRFDPDDVVQSVMRTFFRAAGEGEIRAKNSQELWKLLSTIALNKVRNRVHKESSQKQDVSRTSCQFEVQNFAADPTEQDALELSDLMETLARSLDPKVADALHWMLEGKDMDEIANAAGVTTRTVRRYKELILEKLSRLAGESMS